MIQTLTASLRLAGIEWTIDGTKRYPEEQDVQDVLDRLAEKLIDANEGDRLSVGGLVVQKNAFGHDVYVYVGEYL